MQLYLPIKMWCKHLKNGNDQHYSYLNITIMYYMWYDTIHYDVSFITAFDYHYVYLITFQTGCDQQNMITTFTLCYKLHTVKQQLQTIFISMINSNSKSKSILTTGFSLKSDFPTSHPASHAATPEKFQKQKIQQYVQNKSC